MERASGQHPTAVALRKEVNFCCPIPGCNNVILTYHHFDPPWRERQHNDPAGMIALCPVCHGLAEGGRWTASQLREFKSHPKSQGTIRHHLGLPELGRKAVYRLGGNYILSCPLILSIANRPILTEERTVDGDFVFNLQVFDERDRGTLVITQNSIAVEAAQVWDCFMSTHGNSLLIRKKKGRIALQLIISSLTFDEFRTNVKRDLELLSVANPRLVNPEVAAAVDLSDGFGTGGRLVAQILGDFGSQVMRECVNSDGRVSVVDIKRANLYAHGRWLAVGHGIRGGFSSAGCISWNNVAGFSFPGVYRLEKHWARMKADFTLLDAMIVQREKLLSEIEKSPNAGISRIYEEAVSRYPATMSVASGIVGTRLFHGQFI